MARRLTAKTLISQLHDVAQDAPGAVTVRVGGTTYTLVGTKTATVSGETRAAVIIGDTTLLLELDRRNTMRNAIVVSEPDLQAFAAELLPAPEPPAEVKAAIEAITAIKLPKGWRWGTDEEGNPQPIADISAERGDDVEVRRPRAKRGTAIKKEKKPDVVKGMTLTRAKDGNLYRVSGVDANLRKVTFDPVNAGQGEVGLTATYPAPVFWKNWKNAVGHEGMAG